jgi:OOP family OmpA-OmpF porin
MSPPPNDELNALRRLLLDPERARLEKIEHRLEDSAVRARDAARVLPDAIMLRARDPALHDALAPVVSEAIRAAVRSDPRVFVEAIFPAMGSAIRKAVTAALTQLVTMTARALDYSFSLRGLRWRIEAWRTGVPFAEVVLRHTLAYRVEQVLLIHRPDGLLLQHVSAKSVQALEPDIFSGMLTAIRSFVAESFQTEEHSGLDSLEFGDLKIWVEQGPHASIAAVIRGMPPAELRPAIQHALESIHDKLGPALTKFDGNVEPFDLAQPELERCLWSKEREPKKRIAIWSWLLIAALAWGGVWLTRIDWRDRQAWSNAVQKLNGEPGITVVSAGRKSIGKYEITGLRDPLARDPAEILREAGIPAERLTVKWKPYLSLDEPIIAARARLQPGPKVPTLDEIKVRLNPPPTVAFAFADGLLTADGSAERAWLQQARPLALTIPGVAIYDDSKVIDLDASTPEAVLARARNRLEPPPSAGLKIDGDALVITGSSEHAWIVRARSLAPSVPGVREAREDNFIDTDARAFATSRQRLEEQVIFYPADTGSSDPNQEVALKNVIDAMREMHVSARALGQRFEVVITGHTDSSGNPQRNLQLSQQRAESILPRLVAQGAVAGDLRAVGVGSSEPLRPERTAQDREFNRRVSFKVIATAASQSESVPP